MWFLHSFFSSKNDADPTDDDLPCYHNRMVNPVTPTMPLVSLFEANAIASQLDFKCTSVVTAER